MSSTLETIRGRSSTRGYSPEPLSREQILTLVEAGLQAPTAANRQEIHITVVKGDSPVLAEIEAEKNRLAGVEPPVNFYYDAPVVFLLSGDPAFPWTGVDAGIAVENMALAAEAMGLGSVILGCIRNAMTGEKAAYFAEKLKMPAGCVFQVAIAAGFKAAEKEPHEYSLERNATFL